MVDWDRVEELRSKDWDWEEIASDPKVGFHPDTSVREPGRALRSLYHRQRSRDQRRGETRKAPKPPSKEEREKAERKWNLPRIGYLLVPVIGLWFLFAYLVPSPVGLILPAIPYLALLLVVAAFILMFGLFRTTGARWTKVYRTTLISGIIIGLVFSGVVALTGIILGCPILPAGGTSNPEGWTSVSVSNWQDSGRPVMYFYGATWCPYCSASSWAVWKALLEFGSVSGAYASYSYGSPEPYPYTPEMVLAYTQVSSAYVSFQVSEYVYGSDGVFPGTSNCVQQAYVTAYSGGSIPFLVVNGQFVHGGTSLVEPAQLTSWAGSGASTVQTSVQTESGGPWSAVQTQAWWIMAYIAKANGATPSNLAVQPYYSGWSSATKSAVLSDLDQVA